MTTFCTDEGPASCAYIDGAEFEPALSGVFFALLLNPDGSIACSAVHSSCKDHMIQHNVSVRRQAFARAAKAASNDNALLFDAHGKEVWIA